LSCGPMRPSATRPRCRDGRPYPQHGTGLRPAAKLQGVLGARARVGYSGRGGLGWALGSRASTPVNVTSGLNHVDCHEIAHFVLDEFCPRAARCRCCSTKAGRNCILRPSRNRTADCWTSQQEGKLPSLRELTSPKCYYNSIDPVSAGSVWWKHPQAIPSREFLELVLTCASHVCRRRAARTRRESGRIGPSLSTGPGRRELRRKNSYGGDAAGGSTRNEETPYRGLIFRDGRLRRPSTERGHV